MPEGVGYGQDDPKKKMTKTKTRRVPVHKLVKKTKFVKIGEQMRDSANKRRSEPQTPAELVAHRKKLAAKKAAVAPKKKTSGVKRILFGAVDAVAKHVVAPVMKKLKEK